jgi:hypothetical protein
MAGMTMLPLRNTGGRWPLPIEGGSVRQCCVDWALTLNVEQSAGSFSLRIEQAFAFVSASGLSFQLDPETDPTNTALMAHGDRTIHDRRGICSRASSATDEHRARLAIAQSNDRVRYESLSAAGHCPYSRGTRQRGLW